MQYGDLDGTEQAQNYSRRCSYILSYITDAEERTQYKFGPQRSFFKASETLLHNIHEMKMLRWSGKPKSKMPLPCLFRTLPHCAGTVDFITAVIQVVQQVIETVNTVQNLMRLYKRVVGTLLKTDIECLQTLYSMLRDLRRL